jgi:hypothetical protein
MQLALFHFLVVPIQGLGQLPANFNPAEPLTAA